MLSISQPLVYLCGSFLSSVDAKLIYCKMRCSREFVVWSYKFVICVWYFQDVALASVSMRPIPFSPVLEKLSLTEANHGSVRRFYIQTPEDNAIPIQLQEDMISRSPPEQVFRLKGADHSPFFSRPQTLHKQLVEIAKLA